MRTNSKMLLSIVIFLLVIGLYTVLYFSKQDNQKINTAKPGQLKEVKTILLKKDAPLDLTAKSYLSIYINQGGQETIITEKNKDDILPIASITKLISAAIALDLYETNDRIIVTREAVLKSDAYINLKPGDEFTALELIKDSLVESNNDAMRSLAINKGEKKFVDRMNQKITAWGMKKTSFVNPTGLDGITEEIENNNHSSAYELVLITKNILEKYPVVIDATAKNNVVLRKTSGEIDHLATTTNKLLLDNNFPLKIIGGKTGETPRAKQNLLLITKLPKDTRGGGLLFSVVLNSEDRFGDMKKLIDRAIMSFFTSTNHP